MNSMPTKIYQTFTLCNETQHTNEIYTMKYETYGLGSHRFQFSLRCGHAKLWGKCGQVSHGMLGPARSHWWCFGQYWLWKPVKQLGTDVKEIFGHLD